MSEELSLVISNPNEGKFLSEIEWNKDAFRDLVTATTKQYKDLTYTEDQMKAAKEDRAKLNALKKAIADRRIEIKKAVMAPYEKFEAEVKEVINLLDQPISMIDGQIKDYENRVKNEKREALALYFAEIADSYKDFLTFERVFDLRYLNVSTSLKKAKEDILLKVEQISSDLATVEQHTSERYRMAALDVYKKTLNVNSALAEDKRLSDLDRRAEEERQRREAEERRRVQESQRMASQALTTGQHVSVSASVQQNIPVRQENVATYGSPVANEQCVRTVPTDMASPAGDNAPAAKQYKASFTIHGTKEQIMSVKQFMVDNKIQFGPVEQ